MGFTSEVKRAFFTADNKRIVAISSDVRIWDAKSYFLLSQIRLRKGGIATHCISNDEAKLFISSKEDSIASIWNLKTGKLIVEFVGDFENLETAIFSPDDKMLVLLYRWQNSSQLWNAETGKLLKVFPVDPLKNKNHVFENLASFSPDGHRLAISTSSNSCQLWDISSLKLVKTFTGHDKLLGLIRFSSDGGKLITASWANDVKIYNVNTGNIIVSLNNTGLIANAFFNYDQTKVFTIPLNGSINLWDLASGRRLLEIDSFNTLNQSIKFYPDKKRFIATYTNGLVAVVDANTGAVLKFLSAHKGSIWSSAFSPDGERFITVSEDKTAKTWDAESVETVQVLVGHKGSVSSARFSPDGKKIITTSDDFSCMIWEAGTGRCLYKLNSKHTSFNFNAMFSPDESKIITRSFNSDTTDVVTKVWEMKTGRMLYKNNFYLHAFSKDMRTALAYNSEQYLLVDINTGNIIREIKSVSNEIETAQFTDDNTKICLITTSGLLQVIDLEYDTLEYSSSMEMPKHKMVLARNLDRILAIPASYKDTVVVFDMRKEGEYRMFRTIDIYPYDESVISPDGQRIIGRFRGEYSDSIIIFTIDTIELVKLERKFSDQKVNAVFSPDNQKVLTTIEGNSEAQVWDSRTGKLITNLVGHLEAILSGFISPSGQKAITTSLDNTIRLWDVSKGALLYTLIPIDSADYLIIDSVGHYDGPEVARKMLYFSCGTEVIEIEQVKDSLWVPNLAERISKGESIDAPKLADLNICGYIPQVEPLSSADKTHSFKITPQRGGLGETVLYVNGIEAKRFLPRQLQKTSGGYLLQIDQTDLEKDSLLILGQENTIIVKAYAASNDIASRGVKLPIASSSTKNTQPPNLYALMVGVSDYKGSELDLKYAAKDAADLGAAIGSSARKLLNIDGKEHVFIHHLTTSPERSGFPEKKAIRRLLQEIGNKATTSDILLIFFAGHGIVDTLDEQFRFLTADASKSSTVGISMAELAEWMKPQNIKAQKRILIFDACNSGQAIRDFVRLGKEDQQYTAVRNDDLSQQIKAVEKLNEQSGMFILSASASNQPAYEMSQYNQGILTYALLRSLKLKPEILDAQGHLEVGKWFDAAEKTLEQVAEKTGARQQPQMVRANSFLIGRIDDEVVRSIRLADERPVFASSNFQNSDEEVSADNLRLNRILDEALNYESEKALDPAFSFIPGRDITDAYTLNGRYTIEENKIVLRILVRKNNETRYRFELTGNTDQLENLARKAVDQVKSYIR